MPEATINYAPETCGNCGGFGCHACGGTGWAHALRE
jgi:hypothetical protein